MSGALLPRVTGKQQMAIAKREPDLDKKYYDIF